MGIIDCHVHHYPSELVKDPQAWAKEHHETYWASLVGPDSIQGWASTDQLLLDMDAAGVEKVIFLGFYWQHQKTCDAHNAFQAKCLKEHADRFMAFASVQPLAGDAALEGVKRAIDAGHCGIGEIFHNVQGFEMRNPTWVRIMEWAQENGLPINFHVTDPVGVDYLGKTLSPFEDYEWAAQRFSDLKIILAHLGGLLPFHELNPQFAESAKNIYYDTAACPLMYDDSIYKLIIDAVGADKILFGSDYPLRLYPSEHKAPEFETFINVLKKSGINEGDLNKIFSDNVSKICS